MVFFSGKCELIALLVLLLCLAVIAVHPCVHVYHPSIVFLHAASLLCTSLKFSNGHLSFVFTCAR